MSFRMEHNKTCPSLIFGFFLLLMKSGTAKVTLHQRKHKTELLEVQIGVFLSFII